MHAIDEHNTNNHKEICELAYHGKKRRYNWQGYVLGHKKCHDVQTDLVEQDLNDFTDRKTVNLLLDGIKCNTLDYMISIVSGGSARVDFEASHLMLDEHIRMLTGRSKFSGHNVSTVYAARGNQPGRGDRGKGGCGGGGGRGGSAGMLNGEWDKRGISNGDHDFELHNMNNIDKCWYPDTEYQNMNPLEKLRLYLNQQNQKKSSDWYERKAPTSVNAVSITMSYQISEMTTSITSLANHVKNQDNRLKRLISQQMADKSDSDKLFSISEGEPEGTNRNNGSLV